MALTVGAKALRALYARAASEPAISVAKAALARVGHTFSDGQGRKIVSLVRALASVRLRPSIRDPELRTVLCRLYCWLAASLMVEDPVNSLLCMVRGRRLAMGLETGDAALATGFYGGLFKAAVGKLAHAAELMQEARELAEATGDRWALGAICHIRGHMVELPTGQYEVGQASLDEAVENFRQAGDVSVAALSLFFKAIYGKDRERAETSLAWLDAAASMARRHGNVVAMLEIASTRLLIEARQGRDIFAAAEDVEAQVDGGEAVGHDRLLPTTGWRRPSFTRATPSGPFEPSARRTRRSPSSWG